jgi:hypothetical protein
MLKYKVYLRNGSYIFLFNVYVAVCTDNSGLSERFHEGVWNGRRWSCCRTTSRTSDGCDAISWNPRSAQNRLQSTNSVGSTQQQSVLQQVTSVPLQNTTPNSAPQVLISGTVADASDQSARLGECSVFIHTINSIFTMFSRLVI